jgi:hypothetical protein
MILIPVNLPSAFFSTSCSAFALNSRSKYVS